MDEKTWVLLFFVEVHMEGEEPVQPMNAKFGWTSITYWLSAINNSAFVPRPQDIHTVQACWQAYEIFVLCASIALGLLQLIALKYQDTIWSEHQLYLRTQSRDLPSEKTVKQILAPLFLKQFFRLEENGMIQQIRARLMAVSDEIDDD